MRWKPHGRGFALSAAFVAAILALTGGDVCASGAVNVHITPTNGLSGTKIDIAASGFDDQNITTSQTPTYWAEIGIDSTTVLKNVPVEAHMTWDMSVSVQGLAVDSTPGDHTIWVSVYARDAKGIRHVDDGGAPFRVLDPGPAHPLTVTMHVAVPAHTLADTDIVANVTLQSGAGDKTHVGLSAGVFDAAGRKLVQSLRFPAPAGLGTSGGTDRTEMMSPNRTEQFASEPFRLAPGTWRLHFSLLVNYVAHDQEFTIVVTRAPVEPQPHKLPPHLAPGARN